MSSHDDLVDKFRDINQTAPDLFLSKLTHILSEEEYLENAQSLLPGDLNNFVEDLDRGLDLFDSTGPTYYQCWFELQKICGACHVLPRSHILSSTPPGVSDTPIVSKTADIYEGTLEDTKVRVKRARDYAKRDSRERKLLYHEAVVWKRIRHPNIVPFHGATIIPLQLVSEWMEHGNIMKFLEGHLEANKLGLLSDVAEALRYLHSCNVVHGGISGANIRVDSFGRALVADFTVATVIPDRRPVFGTMELRDLTQRWTAPEVLNEEGPLTEKADVFSFGMLMIQIFTSEDPFHDVPPYTAITMISSGRRPQRPAEPPLTEDIWELMDQCWRQDPKSRPEMSTVLQELASCLLRSLYEFRKSLPEFQVALNQFYDGSKRRDCIDRLHNKDLQQFIDFLSDVSRTEGLDAGLRQRTLRNLREVCGKRAVLPGSFLVARRFPTSGAEPHARSGRAEVWKDQKGFGRGGSGTTDVYIKMLNVEGARERFCGEVAVWASLDHPNILRCFGGTCDPFRIVMEWAPVGHALERARQGQPADRIRLLVGVASGLEYLHSNGVIHGNLKQENILVNSAGHACLSDIRFSRLSSAGETGFYWAQVGTDGCRWAAPEVFQKGEFTQESDVFAYGFLAAEICAGGIFWEETSVNDMKSKLDRGERPGRPSCNKEHALVITELWRVFSRCWVKDPKGRISILDALNILQHLARERMDLSRPLPVISQGIQDYVDGLDEALNGSMVPPKERCEILNQLGKICGKERTVPRAMLIDPASVHYLSTRPEFDGGFGDVYRGEYNGHRVAIKVARLTLTCDLDRRISEFCTEGTIWRHLRHPNILPFFGATMDPQVSKFALVSMWMENGDINEFIKGHPDVNRVQLLVDVALGLQYLHSINIAHGDLKGKNILVKDDQRACLADFGLLAVTHASPNNSGNFDQSDEISSIFSMDPNTSLARNTSGGTERWTSPERQHPCLFGLEENNNRPTKQSDCYELGMVIYEVLCSKVPYWELRGHTAGRTLVGVRPSKPADTGALGFTSGLWWVVECCWLPDRDLRPDVKAILSSLTHAAWDWEVRRRASRRSHSSLAVSAASE